MYQQESKPRILRILPVLKHNTAQKETSALVTKLYGQFWSQPESKRGGGRSALVLIQPLPHNLKGVLGSIIYKNAFNEQKTTTEAAVISSVFCPSLKSLITSRDHTHHHVIPLQPCTYKL
jgi:hypothetical protein